MQNFPVSSVLVKGLLPSDPTVSGHHGGQPMEKQAPRRTLKIEYQYRSAKKKLRRKPIPRRLEA